MKSETRWLRTCLNTLLRHSAAAVMLFTKDIEHVPCVASTGVVHKAAQEVTTVCQGANDTNSRLHCQHIETCCTRASRYKARCSLCSGT